MMCSHGSIGCRELPHTVFGVGVCVCMGMCGYVHPGVVDVGERQVGVFIFPFFTWEGDVACGDQKTTYGSLLCPSAKLPLGFEGHCQDWWQTPFLSMELSDQPSTLFFETQSLTEPGYLVEPLRSTCLKPQTLELQVCTTTPRFLHGCCRANIRTSGQQALYALSHLPNLYPPLSDRDNSACFRVKSSLSRAVVARAFNPST